MFDKSKSALIQFTDTDLYTYKAHVSSFLVLTAVYYNTDSSILERPKDSN